MPIPRKILIRVIGAPILLSILGAILYFDYRHRSLTGISTLLVPVAVLTALEVYGMCRVKEIRVATVAGTACVAAVMIPWEALVGIPSWMADWRVWLPFFLLFYLLFKLVFRFGTFPPEAAALTFLGYWYVTLLRFLSHPPVQRTETALYLLFLLAAGKGSDMAAYVVGKSMGKHRMTPVVSPNKTWEGGIAGGVVGTGAGLAILLATPLRIKYSSVPTAALLFFALVVTIAAQVGDLVKSAFKRWAGVKDSGRLLPEFGGMLDMVDSFLVAAPVAHFGTEILRRAFG